MSELLIRGVRKVYGATVALDHGDLHLVPGEVHVLIGSNGSGKSTLCKIVAGSVRPDAGEVLLDGHAIHVSGPQASRKLGIGIFYQELSLAARRTVAENIFLPALPTKAGLFLDRGALNKAAARYISEFSEVAGEGFAIDREVGRLRADQRQLVEIMKVLATEASILIFDEPTSALDRAQTERFFEVLRRLKGEGRAIVFISHRMDEIFEIGDRVTVIRDGRTVASTLIADTEPKALITHMVGPREKEAEIVQAHKQASEDQTPMLKVTSLGGRTFSDVSFSLRKGEVLGLGGLHGQGQSAVLRALFGAEAHDEGTIELGGKAVAMRSPREIIALGGAYVSGDRGRDGILPGRPIVENVSPIHFLLSKIKMISPTTLKKKVAAALATMNTKYASLEQPVTALSGGNQQKVVIARWLIERPDVLFLDDPTKGIDLTAKADLFVLIRSLAAEGMSIIFYSSEDAELLGNSDRILVFNNGRISRELTGTDRTRYNLYHAAYEAA